MALRKFLFVNSTEGYHEEGANSDSLILGGLSMSGSINMIGNQINNLGSGTVSGDAIAFGQSSASFGTNTVFGTNTTLGDNTIIGNNTALGSTTLSGTFNANNFDIFNVQYPAGGTSAVNKNYVDSLVQGLDVHPSVLVLASGNVALTGTNPIDGVAVSAGHRIVLVGQTDAFYNGIWVIETGSWNRASDMTTGHLGAGSFTFVESGSIYADTGWLCISDSGSDVVDTDTLEWTQFSSAGVLTGGDGIDITGTVVSVDFAASSGLQFTSNQLAVLQDGTRGLNVDGSGLFVKVDGTSINFTGGGALQVISAGIASSSLTLQETYTEGGTVTLGEPVYISANNTVSTGDTSPDAQARVIGIALSGTGGQIPVIEAGRAIGVLAGATAGTPYYLAVGGGLSTSTPGAGQRVIQIGKALTATDLFVQIIDYGKKAA